MTDGEAWARRELLALRARGYSPAAVCALLRASQARATQQRLARPEVARRARRWEWLGAAAWLGLAAGGVQPYRRRLGTGLASWACTSVMLDWHLGMLETETGEPRNLGPADALTLTRAWLIPVVGDRVAPLAVAAAALTDGLDGPLARATAPTRAGRDLESLVDAAVVVAALRRCRRDGLLWRSALVLEHARVMGGFAVGLASYFGGASRPDPALMRAARAIIPLRVAGLMAAGSHRRPLGSLLILGSAAVSFGLHARAAIALRGARDVNPSSQIRVV